MRACKGICVLAGAACISTIQLTHAPTIHLQCPQLSEWLWKQRVCVTGPEQGGSRDELVFEFTLVQRLGGCYDGYWVSGATATV